MSNDAGRFSNLVLDFARDTVSKSDAQLPNIIEYAESNWGLNLKLYPVQRFILKSYYNIELDDKEKSIEITDKFREKTLYTFTEKEYLKFLFNEGRINIKELDHQRRELVLAIGRRGSKTAMSSFIASYETYKLLMLENPHLYYGIPEHNKIGVISVATDKEQAGLLFAEVSGHLATCDLFAPYKESETQSEIRLWTPNHLKKYGELAKPKLKINFKACIAKGLRGPGNIVIVLDELAHFTDQGQNSAETVYKAITPSAATFSPKDPNDPHTPISELSDGRVISISSPLSDSGKFYELYQIAMSDGPASEGMLAIQAPTWEVNCTIASGFLRKEYHKNPEDFMVEYGARFSGRTSKYIERRSDLEACIVPGLKPKHQGPARKPHFMGIDIGLSNDGTAISITHEENGYIELDFHEVRYAGEGNYKYVERLDIEEHIVDWIEDLCNRFYIISGIFDQWHGIGIEQSLFKKNILQLESKHIGKELNSQMYSNFLTLMYLGRLRLFDCISNKNDSENSENPENFHGPLIKELLDLNKTRKSKNIIEVAAPKIIGKHDDASDSLIRSVWLSSSGMRTKKGASSQNQGQRKRVANASTIQAQYNRYRRKRSVLHGESPRNPRNQNQRSINRGR